MARADVLHKRRINQSSVSTRNPDTDYWYGVIPSVACNLMIYSLQCHIGLSKMSVALY